MRFESNSSAGDGTGASKLHAVLIAIDQYEDASIPGLQFAEKDAEAFASVLRRSPYRQATSITELKHADATRETILTVLGVDLPPRIESDDVVVIYFAGHGAPEIQDDSGVASRFLVCRNSKRSSLFATAIDIGTDLVRAIDRLQGRARLVVFIADACFSGYSGGRGILGPSLAELRRTNRAAGTLGSLELGKGVVWLGAASDDEVAWESVELKHGVFSHFVLQDLRQNVPGDTLPISSLYQSVYKQVRDYSAGRQNPTLSGWMAGASLPVFPNYGENERYE